MRIGLVGYGVGGRYFHAPFIVAAEACQLAGVVARSPQRVAEVEQDLPGVAVFGSLSELLDSGVDAVAISTPSQTRRELVLEAIGRGVNVIADKPFAPTAADARDLVEAAKEGGVLLSVFHNRRWDTDITTLRGVLDSESLGDTWRFDSRFDLDQPQTLEAGPTAVCCAIWAVTWWIRRCGCSDRRSEYRRAWIGCSAPRGAPTPASSSPSGMLAAPTRTSRRAS